MTDYSVLKRLAEAATPGPWYQHGGIMQVLSHDCETVCETFEDDGECPDAQFIAAANPAAVLALIAENERLTKAVGLQVIRRFVGDDDQKNIDELVAAGIQVDKELIVQLKAENERLAAACERAEQIIIVECKAASLAKVRANLLEANRDQLRAEVAGLRTGYEAYERVNAELKAENEVLRDDLEQSQYDANAWRNSEESVWIEVFNSEGDDPFISAISGQITVEQLALIQAEILEYREDYFEKESGLYVFRCAHYQAHYDNVGMTEPAHWETDFESYSPFPWEEEGAASGQGEQS